MDKEENGSMPFAHDSPLTLRPLRVRITDAYLVSAYAFTQIRPIGRTSDMRQPLHASTLR